MKRFAAAFERTNSFEYFSVRYFTIWQSIVSLLMRPMNHRSNRFLAGAT